MPTKRKRTSKGEDEAHETVEASRAPPAQTSNLLGYATGTASASSSEPFTISSPPASKTISCIRSGPNVTKITTSHQARSESSRKPLLVFTHGAGGTLQTPAVANFTSGFSLTDSVVAFQGSMNLKSRTQMFRSVVEYELGFLDDSALHDSKISEQDRPNTPYTQFVFGGRSMGARAAVMAAIDLIGSSSASKSDLQGKLSIPSLVLISYPLVSPKGELRDTILLELPSEILVLFVIGEKDSMCPVQQLEDVRRKMQCRSWLVMVEGAGHGMDVSPGGKNATEQVGMAVGKLVAQWLDPSHKHEKNDPQSGRVWWDEDKAEPRSIWDVDENSNAVPNGDGNNNNDHGDNETQSKMEKKQKADLERKVSKKSSPSAANAKRMNTEHSAPLRRSAQKENTSARSTRRSVRLKS